MKSLVTGASGFVGPHLVEHLRRSGDVVLPVDVGEGPDLRDHHGWIERVSADRPEVIFHLAGRSDVGGSWVDPRGTLEINIMGTASVLEAARLASVERVIMISSAEVYGLVRPEDLPITEEHPLEPRSPYGASKQAAESVALHYHRNHGLEVVIARPFNHVGPGQSTRFVASAFADQIAAAEAAATEGTAAAEAAATEGTADTEQAGPTGPAVLQHGDLSPERDLTDVRDVVRAYRLLAESGRPGQVYNVCSGHSTSIASVLETLVSLSDATIRTEPDPERFRPVDVAVQRGSYARLEAETGWRPTIELRTSLADVLEDARRRQGAGLHVGADPIG